MKTFEEFQFQKYTEWPDHVWWKNEDYPINIGDKLYCINNIGVSRELEIGQEYIIAEVWPDRGQFRLTDHSRWMRFRFSPNPYHASIAEYNAQKYNL